MPLPILHYEDGRSSKPGRWRWWVFAAGLLVVLIGANVASTLVLRAQSEARAAAAERALVARQAADLARLRAEMKAARQQATEAERLRPPERGAVE